MPDPESRTRRENRRIAKRAHRRRRNSVVRRVIAGGFVVMLIPVGVSFGRALTAPGTDPWAARSVEWLRDQGLSRTVDWVEHWWYTNNPPPVGGKPKHGLPRAAAPTASGDPTAGLLPVIPLPYIVPHLPTPPNMVPVVTTPLAGEGVWQPTGREVQGLPAVYTAFLRPDPVHTSLVAGAMWMDKELLKTMFVPGLREPGGPHALGAEVPRNLRPTLIAAFNSGFKIASSLGGVYSEGQTVRPLVSGAASLVIYNSGKADVGMWDRDFHMGPDIATVRQNLALIVDRGQPVPGLPSNANGAWGATLGNRVWVWRSGVGVDANGGLVYVAGPGLSATTLATLLQRAGCVRAMELDINPLWVSAYTYVQTNPTDPAAITGAKLLPTMERSNDRYLVPGERDFFALFATG